MRDSLTFHSGGRDVVPEMLAALQQCGLRVMRSFDLRAAQTKTASCVCQRQLLSLCDCQLVVLLVYGRAPEPLTVVVSGHGDQTDIGIASDTFVHPDPQLTREVLEALVGLGDRLNLLSAPIPPTSPTS